MDNNTHHTVSDSTPTKAFTDLPSSLVVDLQGLKGIWLLGYGYIFDTEVHARTYIIRTEGKIKNFEKERILVKYKNYTYSKMVSSTDKLLIPTVRVPESRLAITTAKVIITSAPAYNSPVFN